MTGWRHPSKPPDGQREPPPAVAGQALREATPADLGAIIALERRLFPEDAWTARTFTEEIAQHPDSRFYLIAEEDDATLTGYAGILFTGGHQADVLTIAVHPDRWSRGIGSALLAGLTSEATRRGYTELFLEVREDNPRARTLYRNRGFTEIGIRRGYYQPSGVDAVVMRKELK